MPLSNDLGREVDAILAARWQIRSGRTVPTPESVALTGGAVQIDATLIYSDLADSTRLVSDLGNEMAARVFKAFLASTTRIIRANGGEIRSFDGDRVMGVFVGDSRNTAAPRCALNIAHAFTKILKPKLEAKYLALASGAYLRHGSGADTGQILVIQGGIRNNNDLVWTGRAANVAAKLSGIREDGFYSYITRGVYDAMDDSSKFSRDGHRPMWEPRNWGNLPNEVLYRSSWTWEPE